LLGLTRFDRSKIVQFAVELEDEYERNVREAQRKAENSKSDHDRAAWLRIAQQWLRMLRALRGNETAQEDQSGWPNPQDDDSKA
jgi:hypothetical protein